MTLEAWLGFAAASAALIAIPGPMVALIIANTVDRGLIGGLATVAGSAAAVSIHLALVCGGLAALLAQAGDALFWIKWAGALYLFALGLQSLLKKPAPIDAPARAPATLRGRFAGAFALSITHPKTLAFYIAFFPLFIDASRPALPQAALLSATFFVVALIGDGLWALAASSMRGPLQRAGRWTNIATGLILILAAIGMAATGRA